ncbi:MAG: aminotransferase class I/II-fold pyridoxal phosphate-dependent enzyme, partial [Methylophilaceae bacterium]|nr:aminotransferase class I/II-fold pyridoxal phosphate-dependent enzyme [Methylophilaceae bacterium]
MLIFRRLKKLDFFILALIVSAIFHALFILYVKFEQPALKFIKDKTSSLEVILVNKKSKARPKKAEALAQSNLNGGGNTEEKRRLKSALSWQKNNAASATQHQLQKLEHKIAKAEAEAARKEQRLAALEKQAHELMTQLNATHQIEANPTSVQPTPKSDKGAKEQSSKSANGSELLLSSLEIARLEAQIAKDKHTQKALIFASGYQANQSVLSSLLNKKILKHEALLFFDKYNHASLYQAAYVSQNSIQRYHHLDVNHLEHLLQKQKHHQGLKFVVSETVFGMDGDVAPIQDLINLCKQY